VLLEARWSSIVAMQYAELGATGIKVSRICLGTMTYGSSRWRPWVLDEEASRPLIKQAIDAGINFFDTADMYSLGASEEVLGRALSDFGPGRDQLVIATKVFYPMGPGPDDRGLSRKHIMAAIDASLRRLGTDYVDFNLSRIHPIACYANLSNAVIAMAGCSHRPRTDASSAVASPKNSAICSSQTGATSTDLFQQSNDSSAIQTSPSAHARLRLCWE
jgi:diketogulonate reductase-like aldo/keto reductase